MEKFEKVHGVVIVYGGAFLAEAVTMTVSARELKVEDVVGAALWRWLPELKLPGGNRHRGKLYILRSFEMHADH